MKLFLLTQTEYETTYGMYNSAVVAARNEEEAKLIHPNGEGGALQEEKYAEWTSSAQYVKAQEIGTAKRGTKAGVILASYIGS